MTLVVADTGPVHYLVLIEAVEILPRLFDHVILPNAVVDELTHLRAPAVVKAWAGALPSWVEVKQAARVELAGILGAGEAEAIAVAEEVHGVSVRGDICGGICSTVGGGLHCPRLLLLCLGTDPGPERSDNHGSEDSSAIRHCPFQVVEKPASKDRPG